MTEDHLIELIRVQVRNLEDRMSDHHADLRERIEEIRYQQESATNAIFARLDAHEDYHRRGEHRWGLIKLAARYPFRLATAATAVAMASGSLGSGAGRLAVELLGILTRTPGP